jgi:hypothetical protein
MVRTVRTATKPQHYGVVAAPAPLAAAITPPRRRTVRLARRSGLATKVLRSGRGRAVQMNAGAAAASGELLCFLHADTLPPADLVGLIKRGVLAHCRHAHDAYSMH